MATLASCMNMVDSNDELSSDEENCLEGQQQLEGSLSDNDSDLVSNAVLKRLELSESLKQMLLNPHLQKMLTELDQSDCPGNMLTKAMQIPIFIEYANKCLEICELSKEEPNDA